MKKLITFMLLLSLCMSLVSCTAVVVSQDTAEAKETKAEETTEEITTEEVTTEAPFDWKSAAVAVLAEYIETVAEYSVYDMNGDKNPEIIICTGKNSAETKYFLYDLTKEKSEPMQFGSGSTLLCGFHGQDIILQFGKMGEETVTKYSYDGEKLTDEVILSREVPIGEDYLEFTGLKSYKIEDMSGLSWVENPKDDNDALIAGVK